MATEPRAPYAPDLDGLRAASVAAVAWSHWLPLWQFGVPLGAGVHLFFVLSGMLITRILLDLRDVPDRGAALGRFYLRRLLRLWPAFYVVLALAWVADVPLAATTWPWHAAYLSNVYIAWQQLWQGHFSHFWSLAVEQQFYLLWPWLVMWAPARLLPAVCGVTILLGPLSRGLASASGLGEPFWALVPFGSADSLGVGALVAWMSWAGNRPLTQKARGLLPQTWPGAGGARLPTLWPAVAIAGSTLWLMLAGAEAVLGHTVPPIVAVWRQLLQAGVFGWIVWRGVAGFSGTIGRVLRHPVMLAIGRISYGIYLVHPFAPIVLDAALRRLGWPRSEAFGPAGRAAAAWLTTIVLATLLWHLVEAPWQRLKPRVVVPDGQRASAVGA